ncbi:MAG: hypothetical protein JWM93_2110, partial [Frankiales bacterium]|nr:hypothetical protein [Frankiales bacterium]
DLRRARCAGFGGQGSDRRREHARSDNLSATGGPALDITGTPNADLTFDNASSTNSSTDGINVSGLNGSLTVPSGGGTIAGASDKSVDIDGGNGTIDVGVALNDGPGQTAEITNRTGGQVDLNGPIADGADAGGGIALSGNGGAGTTTFGGSSKVLNTAGADAVSMSSSDNYQLRFENGGLNIDATSGAGITATNSGSLVVLGTGNTVDTSTGAALNVVNTDVAGPAAGGVNFQSIASNGAASGIVLNNTGNLARVNVTGNGGSCTSPATCTGGAIQNSSGPGIALTSVGAGVDLTRMSVNGGGDDGIRATTVGGGLNLGSSRVANNGNAVFERGLDYTNVTGSSTVASTTVTGSAETNARVANDVAGTNAIAVTGSTFSSNSTTTGAHGLEIRGDNGATINASVTGSTFAANRDNAFLLGNAVGSPTMNLHFNNNTVTGGNASMLSGQPGIVVAPSAGAQTKVEIASNTVSGTLGRAIIANPLPGSTSSAQFDATITGNTIGDGTAFSGSAQGEGMIARAAGDGNSRFAIRNNLIRNYAQIGLWLRSQEGTGGTGNADYTVTGNTISNPSGATFEGIFVSSGAASGDNMVVCADIGGSTPALENTFDAAGTGGIDDIGFSKRFSTELRLPGFDGVAANLGTYMQGRNAGAPTVADYDLPVTGQASACALPTLPPP